MAEPDQPAADALAPLRPGYVERLAERVTKLDALLQSVEEGAADLAMLKLLCDLAHNIRGSGSTFGYPALSAAAANLEDHVEAVLGGSLALANEREVLAERIKALRGACEAVAAGTTGTV